MSLSCVHGANQYIDHGSDASLDNLDPVTMMAWINVDALDASERNLLAGKATAGNGNGLTFLIGRTSGDNKLLLERQAGTWSTCDAPVANFSAWGTGKWIFVAGVIEIGVAPRVLVGDLSSVPAEPSAYTTQDAGVAPVTSDAAQNWIVGNGRGIQATFRFGGDVATIHVVAANLTNAELVRQWMRFTPLPTSVLLAHYGFNGTASQPDWSGNGNAGTVTSATVADHVPLGPLFGSDAVSLRPLSIGVIPLIMHHRQQQGAIA